MKRAIVIDGQKMTKSQVRKKAEDHFNLHNVEDWGPEPGDHGTFLGGNLISYYHVASVKKGMYVASLSLLTPDQTRKMVKKFLGEKK